MKRVVRIVAMSSACMIAVGFTSTTNELIYANEADNFDVEKQELVIAYEQMDEQSQEQFVNSIQEITFEDVSTITPSVDIILDKHEHESRRQVEVTFNLMMFEIETKISIKQELERELSSMIEKLSNSQVDRSIDRSELDTKIKNLHRDIQQIENGLEKMIDRLEQSLVKLDKGSALYQKARNLIDDYRNVKQMNVLEIE